MFHRSMLRTGVALCVLAGSLTAAHAASEGLLTCRPHDLNRLAEAIASQDNDALREMLSDPELSFCPEYINTAEAILCADNALACVEPSGGGDPDDQPGDDPGDDPNDPGDNPDDQDDDRDDRPDDVSPGVGPFPGQRPGESLGRGSGNDDNDSGNDGGGDDGGNGGGGSGGGGSGGGGSSGGGSTGGGAAGGAGRT